MNARRDRPARELAEPIALAVVLFVVYALGACPTIYVGDSGELVSAAATLGIPHPSGYPLYVLLGKLWTMLVPAGSVAYRMSLFSAAAASLAVAGLYVVARRGLGLDRHAALFCCGLMAFAPSFWGEANVQRVYTLNALFVVLATGAVLRWTRTPTRARLAALFFLCGVGASNHTFMALYAASVAVYVTATLHLSLATLRRSAGDAASAAGAFAAGLTPYLYLPFRSRMEPRLDWGNPETLSSLIGVVLRQDFWQRAWIESLADVPVVAADYAGALARETGWVGAPLMLVGFVAGRRARAPVGLFVLVMLANLAALTLHGSRTDIFIWHRYYIPSFVLAAMLAGMGWQRIAQNVPPRARWIALSVPALLLATGWRDFDRSRYRIAEDFSYAVLQSLPPGASLLASDDNVLFVLLYLKLVEGRRPDVNLVMQGVGKANLPPLAFDPLRAPVYFTHHPNWNVAELSIVPMGLVYRTWPRAAELPEVDLPRRALDGENDDAVPKDYLTQNLIGHFHYMLGMTLENRDWLGAREEFERAAVASPDNDVLFYNLGLVYERNGLYDDAAAAFERSSAINPRAIASLSKPLAADRLIKVRAESERIESVVARLLEEHPDVVAMTGAPSHRRRAELLSAGGESIAARGQFLRSLEATAQ